MKAAIYNPYLDTLGGGERYTMAFASVLTNANFQVDVCWKDKEIIEQLKNRFGIQLKNISIVDDIKLGDGYDLCFWVSDGSIPLLHARKNILHFQIPFTGVDGRSLFNKMKLMRIEKVVCNSLFTKKVVDEEYDFASKSVVINPPVDTKKFKAKRKENIIVYVGRFSDLVQNKRQDILIDAFETFSKSINNNWQLVLMGGIEVGTRDELMVNLRAKAANLNVKIIESPSFNQIIDIVGRARFFWSASGYGVDEGAEPVKVEHFGITTAEAMSAGVVPLVYDAGGQKSIVEDGVSGFVWARVEELVSITEKVISQGLIVKIAKEAQKRAERYSYANFERNVRGILGI